MGRRSIVSSASVSPASTCGLGVMGGELSTDTFRSGSSEGTELWTGKGIPRGNSIPRGNRDLTEPMVAVLAPGRLCRRGPWG